jgi:hypothetical protein
MSSYDEDEVRRRVEDEVNSLSDYQLRTFKRSQSSLEAWIYRTAHAIGRILAAPIRWIVNLIKGFFDGLFS